MPKDYVKRSKPKPNTRAKRGKQAQAEPVKPTVIVGIIVVIVLVAGFIYFLSAIKGRGDDAQPIKIDTPQPQTEEAALPPPPTEKWEYPDELTHPKKIETQEFPVEQKGPYQMQCGSFRTDQQAQSLKAKIAFVGLESTVKRVEGQNGVWHKVVLGPYERKRLAEADRHKLKANGINYCRIWLWT